MPRAAHKSGAALRYERQLRDATKALAQQAAQVTEVHQAAPAPRPARGSWPIVALKDGQCRFPCTPHTARPSQHLCCGEPVAWLKGKPTSWCRDHLPMVQGAPGRHAGGASVADLAAGRAEPDQPPARTGWGATGA